MALLNGRWSRKTFNLVLLGSLIAAYMLIEVSPFLNIVTVEFGSDAVKPMMIWLTVLLNVGFVLISILRLHDVNCSGWWALVGFIPVVNVLFAILLMQWPSSSQLHKFKNMLKTWAKIFSVILLSVVLLQLDDNLNVEVTEYISLTEERVSKGSEAFLYLNGITALKEESILNQGSQLLARDNNVAQNTFGSMAASDEVTQNETLPTPDKSNELYCVLSDVGCLDNIIAGASHWDSEVSEFAALTKRYETFISYSAFTTMTKADISSPAPAYHYLTFGSKIKIFSALSLAKTGKPEDAIALLLHDNRYLRKHLALADSIIHKLIFMNLLANNLDIIVYIHSAYEVEQVIEIANLSTLEKSMETPFIRAFIEEYNIFLDADQNPDAWGGLPSWMVKIIYKVNMTINARLINYKEMILLDTLSAKAFAKNTLNTEAVVKVKPNYRNYGGSAMVKVSVTYLSKYIEKIHDLNAKISLANFVLSHKTKPLDNPYGELYNKITERDHVVCLEGPLKDVSHLRCVPKKQGK